MQKQEPFHGDAPHLRSPWSRSGGPVARRVVQPLQRFLEQEAASGILLLVAAVVALVWVNSPWRDSYDTVWHTEFTLRLGSFELTEDLQHWINDGLMALFFFVVGLEIKRELISGELRDPRAAALPAVGAFGGVLLPALIYAAFTRGTGGIDGWGIPMATDIAFAVGVLAIVARGLPSQLKVFLLALAIVDDIIAILVIAIFYSAGVDFRWLAIALGLMLVLVVIQRLNVRSMAVYVPIGVFVWFAVFESGVHATIAGVALGFITPAKPFQWSAAVSDEARRVADETKDEPLTPDEDAHHWLHLSRLTRETVSPLARLESNLHPWTSYIVVPLFALANAGVYLGGGAVGDALTSRITLGIVVGLVAGKTIGITAAAWLATKLGIARLPRGVRWAQVLAVSAVGGIGFTVSLFIAGLAFDGEMLDAAKVGVLAASLIAGILGTVLLATVGRARSSAT